MTFNLDTLQHEPAPGPLRRPGRLTTATGWNTFVNRVVTVPELKAGPPDTPVLDDDPRMLYHAAMRIVSTPAVERALAACWQLLRASEPRSEGQLGLIIDGEHDTGMTVVLRMLGRAYQGRVAARRPKDTGFVPVVHLNVPPSIITPADWALLFADFFEMPYTKNPEAVPTRVPDLTGPVRFRLAKAQTQLVLIDGINRLSDANTASAFSFLTWLRDELGLTIVYCGSGARDIVQAGLRGNRIAARAANYRSPYPVITTNPIPYTEDDPETWLTVLRAFDKDLRLYHHKPDTLLDLAAYLHQRTGGYITTLSYLICEAAQLAIETGEEAITRELLASLLVGRNDEDDPY
ncbi:ATP/GTP-binding protein [Kitasatospora sp. NPDC048365]|uniref:ATP/GTP-binding protein n=1 Tax=Kitasatospora sp. NPDC048365 TaxID=3364050 RepID=UPI003714CD99